MIIIKRIRQFFVLASISLSLFVPVLFNQQAYAADIKCQDGTVVPTVSECAGKSPSYEGNPGTCKGCNSIDQDLQIAMNVLSIGIGVVVTLMMVMGGLQYMTSRDNPQGVQAARARIMNAVIAMVSYVFIYAFLQWIVPGGVF
jgi:hypothetical protein